MRHAPLHSASSVPPLIVFPCSIGGVACGSHIPIRVPNLAKAHVARLLAVHEPVRGPVASHIKTFTRVAAHATAAVEAATAGRGGASATRHEGGGGGRWGTELAWVMTGSHNVSKAALGSRLLNGDFEMLSYEVSPGVEPQEGTDAYPFLTKAPSPVQFGVLLTPERWAAAVAEIHARGGECVAALPPAHAPSAAAAAVAPAAAAAAVAPEAAAAAAERCAAILPPPPVFLHAFELAEGAPLLRPPGRALLIRSLVPPLPDVPGSSAALGAGSPPAPAVVLCPVPFRTRDLAAYFEEPLPRERLRLRNPAVIPWAVDLRESAGLFQGPSPSIVRGAAAAAGALT